MKDIKEITTRLEEGIKNVFTSSEYIRYLQVMSRFHSYSFGNCMLIMSQYPTATLVAGFKAWQTKFKRNVKKGAKAIYILAPMPRAIKKVNEETGEEEEYRYNAYRAVPVFDVSQTDGEELPTYGKWVLEGEVEKYSAFVDALETLASVPVRFDDIEGGANGYCSKTEIVIKNGMSEVQTVKTMIHELAHNMLKHAENKEDRSTCEVEAESVAYVVSQFFGIETGDYSFPYIAGWAGAKDKKVIQRVLGNIQKTADKIIGACEKVLA